MHNSAQFDLFYLSPFVYLVLHLKNIFTEHLLFFQPIPTKYFVVHVDTLSEDGLVVRISFSNLFKEFKSTATWLQFPFACHAAKGLYFFLNWHM